jgi:hypothetical protein
MQALIWLLLLPLLAHAECPPIDDAIREKKNFFAQYFARTEALKTSLSNWKTGCHDQGASLSARVAATAAAKSCTAENDTSGMDKQLTELGAKCEESFQQIKTAQAEVRAALEFQQVDIEKGRALYHKSEYLQEACGPEIQETENLLRDYQTLDQTMQNVENGAEDGRGSYSRFKDTARELAAATRARNDGCGTASADSVMAALPGKDGPGYKPESTVTGVKQEASLVSLASNAEEARLLRSVSGAMPAYSGAGASAKPSTISSGPSSSAKESSANSGGVSGFALGSTLSPPLKPVAPSGPLPASVGDGIFRAVRGSDTLELAVKAAEARGPASASVSVAAATASDGSAKGIPPAGTSFQPVQLQEASLFEKVSARYRGLEGRLNASRVAQGN